MGYRYAVANGNWSAGATWDQGIIPVAGDFVTANNFTVTVDTNISVSTLSTLANDNPGILPTMTSNTTPVGYVASASSTGGGSFPWQTFDRAFGTGWQSAAAPTVGTPQWISIQLPIARVVNRYRLYSTSVLARVPNNWTFEGSNDGIAWTVIQTVVGGSPGINAFYTSPLLGNVTAYLYYRINVTATVTAGNAAQIMEMILFDTSYTTLSGVSGGGFNVTTTRTITLTYDDLFAANRVIITGTSAVLNYSGAAGTTLTVNASIGQLIRSQTTSVNCINITNGGTANITAQVPFTTPPNAVTSAGVSISGTAGSVVTFTGDLNGGGNTWTGITTSASTTLTIVGNIFAGTGNNGAGLFFNGGGTVNITGNISAGTSASESYGAYINVGTLNMTGNITGGLVGTSGIRNWGLQIQGAAVCYITGSIIGGPSIASTQAAGVYSIANSYINHVGAIIAGNINNGLIAGATGAINILTGPFVSAPYGIAPFQVYRMHYNVTPTSYYEFRNSSTNGALPPGAIAPPAYMYDPSFISGAPTANNVRSGVVYASGSQTGTLVVPAASSVAAGVVFDNGTIGTAVLTQAAVSAAVWNELVANLTTANSIGKRLSTASTVQTTGAQISSLIGP